jgi:hypothetical protein
LIDDRSIQIRSKVTMFNESTTVEAYLRDLLSGGRA